jgi:RNA polymerase sigma-70 factor (ECF subfamily)
LPHFRGEARVSTWLFGIARSFCARQRRRREGEPVAHEELDSPFAQAVASDLTREEARLHARDLGALIQEALSTIAPEHREVLLLRDVEGYSTEEAASELCISVGALKSRLHRARTSLQLNLSRLQVGQCSMP